jgi:hypothetical protein
MQVIEAQRPVFWSLAITSMSNMSESCRAVTSDCERIGEESEPLETSYGCAHP